MPRDTVAPAAPIQDAAPAQLPAQAPEGDPTAPNGSAAAQYLADALTATAEGDDAAPPADSPAASQAPAESQDGEGEGASPDAPEPGEDAQAEGEEDYLDGIPLPDGGYGKAPIAEIPKVYAERDALKQQLQTAQAELKQMGGMWDALGSQSKVYIEGAATHQKLIEFISANEKSVEEPPIDLVRSDPDRYARQMEAYKDHQAKMNEAKQLARQKGEQLKAQREYVNQQRQLRVLDAAQKDFPEVLDAKQQGAVSEFLRQFGFEPARFFDLDPRMPRILGALYKAQQSQTQAQVQAQQATQRRPQLRIVKGRRGSSGQGGPQTRSTRRDVPAPGGTISPQDVRNLALKGQGGPQTLATQGKALLEHFDALGYEEDQIQ